MKLRLAGLCLLLAVSLIVNHSHADPVSPAASAGSGTPGDADPPPLPSGPPEDLSGLDRPDLENWVEVLVMQNRLMLQRLRENQRAIDQLRQRAEHLDQQHQQSLAELDRLRLRLADAGPSQATDSPSETSEATPVLPSDNESAGGTQASARDGADADDPVWKYRFAYEFGLIREAGRGRVTLRDRTGKRTTTEYSYSEYRQDALWINLFLRNDSPQPMRFTGVMSLQGDKPLFAKTRRVYTSRGFATPMLQPGEVYQLPEDEVAVNRPWQVDHVELLEVRGFADPL